LSIILDSEKPEKIANMKYEDQVIVTIYSPPQGIALLNITVINK
jgi:hypothetical protein